MIKQECIGIPDMILLLMIFCFKKIKIKAEIVLSPGGAYFQKLQFLKSISSFWKFRTVTAFSQQTAPQETNRSTVLVSGETPRTKNLPLQELCSFF